VLNAWGVAYQRLGEYAPAIGKYGESVRHPKQMATSVARR